MMSAVGLATTVLKSGIGEVTTGLMPITGSYKSETEAPAARRFTTSTSRPTRRNCTISSTGRDGGFAAFPGALQPQKAFPARASVAGALFSRRIRGGRGTAFFRAASNDTNPKHSCIVAEAFFAQRLVSAQGKPSRYRDLGIPMNWNPAPGCVAFRSA